MLDSQRLKEIFKDYPYIASAYLFGSQASGRTGPMSDVDVALLLKKPHPEGRELIHQMDYLGYRLEEIYRKEVDIVELNRQPLIFRHNVLRTGKLVYDADPPFRVRFEMRVITSFCDFEPTLRFMNKYFFEGYRRRLAKT
ncbi:nucleotidyltransferase domain protein [bacterium BMS3Bbin06]|nr:nucleotidyltransferase domain protein [bacterium BMS3Bbin06]